MAARNDVPLGHESSSRLTRGTFVAAAFAVLVAQVALAIPAVLNGLFQKDLGTDATQLTWISDAFLVPVTLFELTFGVLGDMFGRKRLLIGGAVLLALGSAIAVFTPGASSSTNTRVLVLWTGQIVAGIGAAALFPTTLAMIAAGTLTAQERGRGIAIWAAALSSGGFISPVLGGLLTKLKFGSDVNAGWRWAFVAVAALAILSASVSALCARDSSAPAGRSLDWPGQSTVAIALFALLFAVIEAPTRGWGSTEVTLGFLVAAAFFALFIMVERRSVSPILRLDLFSSRAFSVTAVVTVVGMFAMLGTAYATSIRLGSIQGFSPLKTSIAFLLLNGFTLVQVPITSRLLQRVQPRWIMTGGFAMIALGDFWIATRSAADLSIAPVILPLAIIGIGFASCISAVTAVAVNSVPVRLAGMASATTGLMRDFGFTLGPALIGAIALSRAASEMHTKVASSPAIQKGLAGFYSSIAHAPASQRPALGAAIGAVKSGPLGANSVPPSITVPGGHVVPFNPVQHVAFHALDSAYSLGYVVCGAAAAVAVLLALVLLRPSGEAGELAVTEESAPDLRGALTAPLG